MSAQGPPQRKWSLDLGLGWPGDDLYPDRSIVERLCSRVRDSAFEWKRCLQYGDYEGSETLRRALADRVLPKGHSSSSAESLYITAGATDAISMSANLVKKAGKSLAVVDRTSYPLGCAILETAGLQVIAIPSEQDGFMELNHLESFLKRNKGQIGLIYVIPTHSNPSSGTMSNEKREGMVKLCKIYDVLIVSDEVYAPLTFSDHAIDALPMSDFDPDGDTVVTVGSMTKLSVPGFRLGWMQFGSPEHARAFSSPLRHSFSNLPHIRSGGGANQFAAELCALWLASEEFGQHLNNIKSRLREKYCVLAESLRTTLGEFISFPEVSGGYYIWCSIRPEISHRVFDGCAVKYLKKVANAYEVNFMAGSEFDVSEGRQSTRYTSPHMRLCFAFLPEESLLEATIRLRWAFSDVFLR